MAKADTPEVVGSDVRMPVSTVSAHEASARPRRRTAPRSSRTAPPSKREEDKALALKLRAHATTSTRAATRRLATALTSAIGRARGVEQKFSQGRDTRGSEAPLGVRRPASDSSITLAGHCSRASRSRSASKALRVR